MKLIVDTCEVFDVAKNVEYKFPDGKQTFIKECKYYALKRIPSIIETDDIIFAHLLESCGRDSIIHVELYGSSFPVYVLEDINEFYRRVSPPEYPQRNPFLSLPVYCVENSPNSIFVEPQYDIAYLVTLPIQNITVNIANVKTIKQIDNISISSLSYSSDEHLYVAMNSESLQELINKYYEG